MRFPIHTAHDAPTAARPTLAQTEAQLGFVPNLLGTMATAPSLLTAYTTVARLFDSSSLSATERQIVLLAASRENDCEYCMAAHTVLATMQSVSQAVIGAVRDGREIDETRLEALRQFAAAVVSSRGWPEADVVTAFFAAGYGQQQALEVILGVGLKTLSNYTNHLAQIPVDAAFAAASWSRAA